MPLGNSVEALTPATGTFTTPVPVGSEPTRMALSDDGQILYVLDTGSSTIVRLNLATQQIEGSIVASIAGLYGNIYFAVQPGSENTVALPLGQQGVALVDFNPATHSTTVRASTTGASVGGALRFLNASTLVLDGAAYTVSASGLTAQAGSFTGAPGAFQIANGTAFFDNGAVVDVADQPNSALGTFAIPYASTVEAAVAPDPAFGRAYYLTGFDGTNYTGTNLSGIAAFDTRTYTADAFLPLNIAAIDGSPSPSLTPLDLFRWGQDGLAALTSAGTIYLIRGPAVVPQLLQSNSPATLAAASPNPIQHGSGNLSIAVTGTNFLPGVAVLWNGSYRTTIFVDASHLTVDLPRPTWRRPARRR